MNDTAGAAATGSSLPAPDLDTDPETGLDAGEVERRLAHYGENSLPERKVGLLARLASYFWGPIPWMIEAAAVMAAIVGDWGDFAIILVLLLFNAGIGFWEERKASDALEALKGQLALKARVLRSGTWVECAARALVPGDIVRLQLGDVVPADVKLLRGDFLSADESALTGESLPVSKSSGDAAYSGAVVKQGEMIAVVTATGGSTFFGRTAKLVEAAGGVSHFQRAVMKVGDFLILVALVLAVILVGVEVHRGTPLAQLAEFVLILLVASIPVAMPAVLSVTLALGAQALAGMKAIVSRLQSIEEMAGIDILCSDKTGTLTKNELTLGDPQPAPGVDVEDLLQAAALASKEESGDAIDLAVLGGLPERQRPLAGFRRLKFTPFDPVSKRTEARVATSDGQTTDVSKGAPQVILDLCAVSGDDRKGAEAVVQEHAARGYRTLGVARRNEGQSWVFLGVLPLLDPPRDDSKATIEAAAAHGIGVKMVTGDNTAIASEIARQLGMGEKIQRAARMFGDEATKGAIPVETERAIERAEGFAEVFPEHKYAIVKALQDRGHLVGMTGDGVNDAPALKQADIGIAVSGATEAARAAADLVLTQPGLSVIIKAVEEARRIFERMMSYTIYRIAMTLNIMGFVVLASLVFGFFPLTPIMIIALALLDDVPIMTIAYDRTRLSPTPVRWDMGRVLGIASTLGLLAIVQSYGLLYLGEAVLHLDTPHLQTLMFLQLVAGGHLLLFLTRTPHAFWRPPHPSLTLFGAIVGTQVLAVLMAGFGWLVPALPWIWIGLVWGYNLVWMFVQDGVKIAAYRVLDNRASHKVCFLGLLNLSLHEHGHLHLHRRHKA